MAQDRVKQLLQQGIAAAKAGQKDQARQILQQAVKIDPRNETIWLWLSSVAKDDKERIFCLKQILALNPQSELAIKGLQALGVAPEQQAAQPPAVPVLPAEKLNKIQASVDEFLRTYNPEPSTILEIEWVQKNKRRYGESAARTVRRSAYVIAAGVAALLVIAIVAIALTIDLTGEKQANVRASVTPSHTPTNTPTATPGIPNTPTPDSISPETPVPVPQDLPVGNIYGGTPTAIYPPFNNSINFQMQTAVAYYSIGNYDGLSTISANERTAQPSACFPETYYYEAIALAEQGGRFNLQQANDLLETALRRERVPNFSTCEDSPLLSVGLCVVDYYQALADPSSPDAGLLEDGAQQCSQAIETDNRIEKAYDTLAQIYLVQASQMGLTQSYNRAISVLNQGLEIYPASVNLLLTRSEVELSRGNPEEALIYLARAQTVDPASEKVLRLRAQAYLNLASLASGQERIIRYGRAAIAAEEYLLYYSGDPNGYILLAEARLQEGNVDRAIFTLNRVIDNADTLPETAQPAIIEAYSLRVRIYQQRLNWPDAIKDLDTLISLEPDNLTWVELHAQAARELRRYPVLLSDLDTLLTDNPTRGDLILEKAQILSQTCQYEQADIQCDYQAVLNDLLTPDFVSALTPDQRANASVYQAEANFAQLLENTTISASNRRTALQAIRQTVQNALAVRESAEDYYLLARVLTELEEPEQALEAYSWIVYWNQFYEYPFGNDAERAAVTLRNQLEDTATS
ncbi:MAG: hypothetical protein HY862_22275 [Chloroflexi bacterium]|nr:hypothetical protein [Chloroflexota bacterium]